MRHLRSSFVARASSARSSATMSTGGSGAGIDTSCSEYFLRSGASFLKATGSGVIHEHAAHQPGRDAKEMRAILPPHALRAGQPNECFVDQRRRLKSVVAPLAGHVAPSQPPELGLDERQQVLERLRIAVAPGSKQVGDLPR